MKSKILIGFFILGIFVLLACKKNKDDNPTNKPGYFVFTQINANKSTLKSSVQNNSILSNEFDLGDIKKSTQFYFSLSNGGNSNIFDISLSFKKSGFTIFPAVIENLNVNGNVSLVPILKVGVIHGLNLDGLGNASLLNKGVNEDTLSINGKTISGKDTINVHLDVVLHVNALLADISIYDDSNAINFNNYSIVGTVLFPDSTANSGLDKLRAFNYSNSIKIINTGNVTLEISIYCRKDTIGTSQPNFNFYSVLQPGISTNSISVPLCKNGSCAYIYGVKINSNGTISDINKLPYGSDGKIYFAFINYGK